MGSRKGAVTYDIHGIREVETILRLIAKEDLNPAKRDLRQGTKTIANEVLIPALTMSANASGVPIAPAMAKTMRTRTDRVVTVRIGAVNPKLSGFRKGVGTKVGRGKRQHPGSKASGSQGYRTTLAWGSERGPWPGGHALHKDGSTGAPVNNYAVPRRPSHWAAAGAAAPATWRAVKNAYQGLLNQILRDYGEGR